MSFKEKLQSINWLHLVLELVIVFLGVTAGFLLNNWQMQREDDIVETKYLKSFLKEADENIKELKEFTRGDSLWLEKAKPLLVKLGSKKLSRSEGKDLITKIIQVKGVDIRTGVYEDISNSGNLNLISNYSLKNEIVDFYLFVKSVTIVDNFIMDYYKRFIMPFIFRNFNVVRNEFLVRNAWNSDEFANVVAGYFALIKQRRSYYKKMLGKSIVVKSDLEKVLKER